ncbi:MAG: decaprenyl-phosphate phosphoribosyltransferase [Ferrimicrobium sp.]
MKLTRSRATTRSLPVAMVVAMRPRQWIKNLLVFAAPIAAGKAFDLPILSRASVAFIALTACAAAIYLINDVIDRDSDRQHPSKCHRPIAAGELTVRLALVQASVLLLAGNIIAGLINPRTLAITLLYSVLTIAYSLRLKREPVLDIAVVALGFVLRAVAGGVATNVFISHWFLLVTGFGSLFMVAGKRYSELISVDDASRTREVLTGYTTGFLNFVRAMSGSAVIITYCLWTFEHIASVHDGSGLVELAIVPFVLIILRYALLIEHGSAESPEHLITSDIPLLVLGILWAGLLGGALYLL